MSLSPRRAVAAAVLVLFTARSTGAADPALFLVPPLARPTPPAAFALRPAASPSARPTPAPALLPVPTAPLAAPAAPPPDRILLASGGLRLLAIGGDIQSHYDAFARGRDLRPVRDRVHGRTLEAGPLRARVDYLAPVGLNRPEERGFRVTFDGKEWFFSRVRDGVPASLRGLETGVYFEGQTVAMEARLENRGDSPLTVRVRAVQESFAVAGGEGAPLSGPYEETMTLAPGERRTVRWSRVLDGGTKVGMARFEQTHLRVTTTEGRTLLDAPQAGIVDPPAP